ncbi:hypothetical protein L0337_34510 [candidate division KSB1 bacterium]|nr:hypothetical protein [candidate division KSB1 bacterium]
MKIKDLVFYDASAASMQQDCRICASFVVFQVICFMLEQNQKKAAKPLATRILKIKGLIHGLHVINAAQLLSLPNSN